MQHLAGRFPQPRYRGRWILGSGSGGCLSGEWIRVPDHNRKYVGVVRRLVPPFIPCDGQQKESGGPAGRDTQGDKGRVVLVPRILLQPLSGGCTDFQHSGQLHHKYRLSMRAGCGLTRGPETGAVQLMGCISGAQVCLHRFDSQGASSTSCRFYGQVDRRIKASLSGVIRTSTPTR